MAAVASTAVAVLVTGPLGGFGEAARQVIALAVGTQRRRTCDDILKRLRRGLEEFAAAENLPEGLLDEAFSAAELAIRRGGVSVAECFDLKLEPHKIADRVLARASDLLKDLDDGAGDICRQVVRSVYDEILAAPEMLPELQQEFQRPSAGSADR